MSRIEEDSMGEISVESSKYWGAQTQRSFENFKIGNDLIPNEVIIALALIKKAAAVINNKLGLLPDDIKNAIVQAADEVVSGKFHDNFPLVVWQTGSGTQTNMNMNEVISNRAIEIMGGKIGSKKPVHPNNHVNMGQSSNDTFPTAMHIAAIMSIKSHLLPSLEHMHSALVSKQDEFKKIVKIGRTHMQDAVPMTLGQEFSCFAAQLASCKKRLKDSLKRLMAIPQGGSAVGTGLNVHHDFARMIAEELSEYISCNLTSADNKFELMAAHDVIVDVSGTLNTLAVSLMKIANDIKLLASGPRCGLGELLLPENEPGSSIMPGKINPTQCEAMTMVCAQVMGNHITITIAGSHGQLQLNVFKTVMIDNLIQSINLLADVMNSFAYHCLVGIEPNIDRIDFFLKESLMLATVLNPHIGYDKTAEIVKYAHENNIRLREAAVQLEYLTAEEFDKWVKPEKMV